MVDRRGEAPVAIALNRALVGKLSLEALGEELDAFRRRWRLGRANLTVAGELVIAAALHFLSAPGDERVRALARQAVDLYIHRPCLDPAYFGPEAGRYVD